nr:EOG090X0JFZ [Sida crystallina]
MMLTHRPLTTGSTESNHFLLVDVSESEDQLRLRFQVELEFVQCLANPNYLHFLAQRGYFKDAAFINYLKYLLYWKEPQYAKYLKQVHSITVNISQLKEMVNGQCAKFIDDQQILHWQHYTRKRVKLLQNQADKHQMTETKSS